MKLHAQMGNNKNVQITPIWLDSLKKIMYNCKQLYHKSSGLSIVKREKFMVMNKSACITLRCYPDLKERIVSLARKENRSQSAQVIHLLEMALNAVETQEILEPPPTSEGIAEWTPTKLGGERYD